MSARALALPLPVAGSDPYGRPVVAFFGARLEPGSRLGTGCFSQWFGRSFELDGVRYRTAEHAMMHAKAVLFGDQEAADAILAAPTARDAKGLGRKVRAFEQARWEERSVELVTRANLAKFSQHPDLREVLLSTEGALLVEASPYDRIWGAGIGADDPRICEPRLWPGRNLLGGVLMDVRDRLA